MRINWLYACAATRCAIAEVDSSVSRFASAGTLEAWLTLPPYLGTASGSRTPQLVPMMLAAVGPLGADAGAFDAAGLFAVPPAPLLQPRSAAPARPDAAAIDVPRNRRRVTPCANECRASISMLRSLCGRARPRRVADTTR